MTTLLLDCVPDGLEVQSDDDGFTVITPFIVDGSRVVSLDCRLENMPDHGPSMFEFSFGFTIDDWDGGELTHSTQDRFEVERYFNGHSTEFVLHTVCAALALLVESVQPDYIFRVTKGVKLPQKALTKHLLVTDVLLGLGFRVIDTGTDDFDRLFWLMGR